MKTTLDLPEDLLRDDISGDELTANDNTRRRPFYHIDSVSRLPVLIENCERSQKVVLTSERIHEILLEHEVEWYVHSLMRA